LTGQNGRGIVARGLRRVGEDMATATSMRASRFEVAETRMVVPPELQWFQTTDAAHSQFAARYLAYRYPLRFSSDDPTNRCDTYHLSPWMVMAVVDVASVDRFESPLHGQDIVEFHYRRFLGRVSVS
jgi:hypothetical protein